MGERLDIVRIKEVRSRRDQIIKSEFGGNYPEFFESVHPLESKESFYERTINKILYKVSLFANKNPALTGALIFGGIGVTCGLKPEAIAAEAAFGFLVGLWTKL